MKNDERLYWKAKMRTLFYRKTRQNNQDDGDIVLRIEINAFPRAEFRTGVRAKVNEWDSVKKRFGVFSEKNKTFQRLLESIEDRAFQINNLFFDNDIQATPAKIAKVLSWIRDHRGESYELKVKLEEVSIALDGKQTANATEPPVVVEPVYTLMQCVNDLLKYLEITQSTKNGYRSSFHCLEKYLTHIGKPDMAANDFTEAEALKMADYLRNEHKKQLSRITIKIYISNYALAMKEAKRRGYIAVNHLSDFEYKAKSEDDLRNITNGQILELMLLPNLSPDLEKLRDMFLFMLHTGMHYIDYVTLTKEDIVREDIVKLNGETQVIFWLEKKRVKSKVTYHQKLNTFALQIISKYGTVENMPRFKYFWVWWNLKKLGKMTSIPFDLLSKIGRKTKTNYYLNLSENPLSLEATAISLGMSNINTVSKYAQLGRERVKRETEK